ncbi:hypothetical protein KBC86_00085 [Candidatus Gracilibacteria bacterium]|nr:hypothetical protein [Candidatus Gracilibacteria bacterium]
MEVSRKQILLEILSELKDIWDWAPILESNIENGIFNDAQIAEIEEFLREKAKSERNEKERANIALIQNKLSKYRALEQIEKKSDREDAESVLGFFS